ncbi:glycerol-3-phosphate ABC transporter ATP-binding protein [bacterium SCN 62-11]|nr:MAG: glycerol-3-phosphate ABC transporter ATP-binding protein [bacterium SCN 62-11]
MVKNAELKIKDGEFVVLVGPSGCGKSTTLRMIAGLEDATSGEIVIGDRVVNNVSPKERDIAMVFQSYALYPHMTVFENMAFGLRLRNLPNHEIETAVKQASELLGLDKLLQRKPKELSGGQRQRVAMGRAIVRKPQVYLMDEPLSNLDAKLRVQMRAELQKMHRRLGVTTVYVTHDQVEAMTLGDRIVIMKDGIIQQADSPLNLYERPSNLYVAGFIGTPSMNFIPVTLQDGELVASGFRVPLPEDRKAEVAAYNGKALVLGLRPTDLTDDPSALTMQANVDVIEPLGSENYLYCTVGKDLVAARVDGRSSVRAGDSVTLGFKPEQFHLFDAASEQAISHARSGKSEGA